jgi:NitT/TauT family transport system substrate-binding protein
MLRLGRIWVAAAAAFAMLAVAGCGGEGSTSSSSAAPAGSASATAGSSTAPAGATGSQTQANLKTLRVAVPAGSFLDLPTFIAQSQGYFAKRGLNVKAVVSSIPFSQQPAALGKSFDLIIGTQPDLINAGSHGIDLVAVSGVNHDNPKTIPGAALIVPKGSPIQSIKDLGGKTVGAPSLTGNNWLSLLCWAKKNGVEPSSIRGLQAAAPEIPDLLKQGRFQSALLFQPLINQALKGRGVNLGDSYTGCFGTDVYTSVWLANGSWARANRSVINAFLAGLTQAKQYMVAHPSQTRQMFVSRSGLPAAVASVVPIDPTVLEFRPIASSELQPWLGLMKEFLGFNQSVNLQNLVLG